MKARVLIPLATLVLACSSTDDTKGHASGGMGSGATGATGAVGSGGTSMINVGGSSNASGGSANGSSSGGSANGTSADAGKTAADLRANACNGWTNEPEVLPVVLMLVVDNSKSMDDRPNNQQGGTKWEITRDALAATLDGMPATAAVGVLFYPNMDTRGSEVERPIDQCVNINQMIPIDLLGDAGSAQRSTIAMALTNTRPAGSTPTHDAYDYALVNGMQASRLTGNRFMLLITDGAPTLAKGCQGGGMPNTPAPTSPIVDEVLAARQEGIRSFLIGSPGSESVNGMDARGWLSEAAVLGATAREGCSIYGPQYCHIDLSQDPDFKSALNAALARILGLITSCTFDVPATGKDGQTVNQNQINVIYTPGDGSGEQLIGRDDTPDCQNGWQFDSDGRIVLCANTCFTAQNDPDGKVELLFGCDSVPTGEVR